MGGFTGSVFCFLCTLCAVFFLLFCNVCIKIVDKRFGKKKENKKGPTESITYKTLKFFDSITSRGPDVIHFKNGVKLMMRAMLLA